MFNLIISIIAIALVVVLAGASLYYGGSAFNEGSSDAKAATLINQAQQIQASATLYAATEGGAPLDLHDDLVDGGYMSAEPVSPVGGGADAWVLADASDIAGDTGIADIVAIKIAMADKSDEGITGDICNTVNADGAGVVFCTVGAGDGSVAPSNNEDPTEEPGGEEPTSQGINSVEKGEGSTESEVNDAVASGNAAAIVHMTI